MNFDPGLFQYHSRRSVLYANKGMVATSTPQAAQVGIDVLKKGGNAIDAAVAAAACLTVVEPGTNGIGGDSFALIWSGGKLHGLNASGPAPKKLNAAKIRAMGYDEMPKYGWLPVTVPGAPASWAAMTKRFGKLTLSDNLAGAVAYAREGFPIAPNLGSGWDRVLKKYKEGLSDTLFKIWFEHFSVHGETFSPGAVWKNEHTARTLELIGASNGESFYKGELADRIIHYSDKSGGYLSKEDLENYQPEWVEPLGTNYRGYDVWEIPPNGHGISVLMALNILKGFDLSPERESVRNYHLQMESMKLAYIDAKKYVTDMAYMSYKPAELLSQAYADERRKLIGKTAVTPAAGTPPKGGTVYLATADGDGNMVSFIQSNYMGFGSGIVVPETGISLQNRGNNFSLEDSHENVYEPGKRPYHTIIPGFMSKDGEAVGAFGVMGGFMQPQGHLQMVCNSVDFNMNPQDALNAPRWQWTGEKDILVEADFPRHVIQQLRDMGHVISITDDINQMGRGQIIWRMNNGVLCGATEPRADGSVAVY